MIYREINKNLFSVDDSYALGHCISKDAKMGAGIAKQFVKEYPDMKKVLLMHIADVGDTMGYQGGDKRIIFNLITKEKYYNKPTYSSFTKSIVSLRDIMIKHNIDKVAIPKIGSGLDGLSWSKNSMIIQDVFKDTDIEILVCVL